MTQYYSRIDATLNGDVYNIPFSYMKESEISVYINDEPITAWEFLNASQIKINEMPSEIPADAIVSIRRTTDITKKVVDYTNQSMLKKESLNKSQDQLLNAIQEVYDNNLNFRINTDEKIEDFKTEVNDTIKEVNEAASKINELEASVNLATESAINAEQSALLASEKAELTIDKIEELENKTLQIDLNTEKINENTQAILTKANTALNNLTDEGKAKFDSPWVSCNEYQIFSNVGLSSSTYSEYTLDFLPDNGVFELNCMYMTNAGANNGYVRLALNDESESYRFVVGANTGTAYNAFMYGQVNLIVSNKKVKAIKVAGGNGNEKFSLTAVAYRKLGTGFEAITQNEGT